MSINSEGVIDSAVTQHLEFIEARSDQPSLDKQFRCHDTASGVVLSNLADIDDSDLRRERVVAETTLRHAAEERHLATLEATADR